MAASVTMATPLHHHLKLNGDTPRTGRPLFWVISPDTHTPICVQRDKGGEGYFTQLADKGCATATQNPTDSSEANAATCQGFFLLFVGAPDHKVS